MSTPEAANTPSVPGYRIVGRIGRGGMGEVLHAVRIGAGGFRKDVALKRLNVDHQLDGRSVQRFLQEARISARLEHPNVVEVHDLLVVDAGYFIVMELLRGETLSELVKLSGGKLAWWVALAVAEQALAGLDYAHGRNVIHRDLTPRNLFVCEDGTTKILDFGIAKLREGLTPGLTQAGHLQATLEYVAPELARGKEADARSDLFQMGGAIHYALTGEPPHGRGAPAEILSRALHGEPAPLPVDVPPSARELLAKTMAKDPDERFQTAAEMRLAVREALRNEPNGDTTGLSRLLSSLPRTKSELPLPETLDDDAPTTAAAPPSTVKSLVDATPAHVPSVKPLEMPAPVPRRRAIVGATAIAAAAAGFAGGRWSASMRRAAPAEFRPITFQRGIVHGARYAPDGRIVYAATWGRAKSDVYIAERSPETRGLGINDVHLLAMSSRGEMALLSQPKRENAFVTTGTLARAGLAGGAPREVIEGVQWALWSPDGSQIGVVRWTDEGATILEHPLGTKVYSPPSGWIGNPRLSPDARWIAFVEHPRAGDDGGRIAIVPAEGGEVRHLTEHMTTAQGLSWSPRGDEIWFTAARHRASRELRATTLDGRERLLVRVPAGLTVEDVSREGTVLARRESLEQSIAASRDGNPERDFSYFDTTSVMGITRDGRTVLISEGGGVNPAVYVRRLDDSPVVRIAEGQPRGFSGDGRSALVIDEAGSRLRIVPTAGALVRDVPSEGLRDIVAAAWFPDGKRILVHAHDGVSAIDLATGARKSLDAKWRMHVLGEHVAPGGRMLALIDRDRRRLRIVDLETGRAESCGAYVDEVPVTWSEDGRTLYVASQNEMPVEITALDIATSARTRIRELEPIDLVGVIGVGTVVMTPDAKSYAYGYLRALDRLYEISGVR